MKPEELRIGNWVKYRGEPVKVEQLRVNCLGIANSDVLVDYNEIEPIELTEEVLVKIGFKKNQHNDWREYHPSREDEVSILMSGKYTTIEYANLFHAPEDVPEVIYDSKLEFPRRICIHELQNVYYITTDKELKIEL